ncbi:MAG: DUF459 domain-containing protein [Myxococcales bacterium]|nr:DUF459 domain-containing protein [Myxococcales bacterium]MCB9731352.1 DUF459 domain-containing protein [Deltaproteobacteria bacterium]
MRTAQTPILAAALAAGLALGALPTRARAERAPSYCPDLDDSVRAYAIGSSTLGNALGPILKDELAADDIPFSRYGKASSGLARPDFHDWVKLAPGLIRRHRPDVVVVSLGTNDYQDLFHHGKWVSTTSDRWDTLYRARVDRLLKEVGGDGRLVVWVGNTAFDGKRAKRMAPRVAKIIKAAVRAYAKAGGHAVYVDAYHKTADRHGEALTRAVLPGSGSKKKVNIRHPDGVHLTHDAVRWLLAEPVLTAVRACLPSDDAARADDSADESGG